MRYLIVFFCLFKLTVWAQKPLNQTTFRIDSLPKNGVLLDKDWKWHAGDKPEYARPDFDDSKWESIDVLKAANESDFVTKAKLGWFRIKINIDSSLVNQPLAFNITQIGASELFLNGLSIGKIGMVSADKRIQKDKYFSLGTLTTFSFKKSGENVLAVRYSISTIDGWLPFNLNGKKAIFKIKLLNPNGVEERKIDTTTGIVAYYGILGGIFGILSILYFIFYGFYRKKITNLTFAILLFFGFLHFLLSLESFITNSAVVSENLNIISTFSISIHIVMFGFLLFQLLNKSNFLILWIIGTIHMISVFLVLSEVSPELSYLIYNGSILFLCVFCVIIIFKEIKDGHQNGKPLLFAFILLFVFYVLRTLFASNLINFGSYTSTFANIFMASFYLCLPIAIAVLLAKEHAFSNRMLESKIIENEQLFAEKQQILATQNETLEKQVKERTKELNQSLEKLKSTQAQLIQKEKLASLGELTAGIAHEIQNPLNFVNNFSELSVELIQELSDEIKAPIGGLGAELLADISQNLEKINHHGKRASNIVRGMLEHSRSSSGERQETDLNVLADEYLRLSYHGLRAKDKSFNSDFKSELDESIPKINLVPQDLGRVLLNLYNNAFYEVNKKAKENLPNYKPMVNVTTKKLEKEVEIRVKDNANGIPEAIKSKIFQPFFTTKPTGEGTGLGLSLSYDIITQGHNGSMQMESTEGEGTTFIIKLPIL